MEKLSICIPTYNRSDYVISQLIFLEKEILPFKEFIDIIVADNFSTSEHRDKLINYHLQKNFFNLKLNPVNIGSIGNIYYLLENVNSSDYVWFVSDDDILLSGVINRVMKILNDTPVSYLFLNYNAFYKDPGVIAHTLNLLGYAGYLDEGKQCIIKLFQENGPVSMFITSCVYAVAPLKAYTSSRHKQLLIDPLLFSFKLAQGPIYIEKEVFVLERCDAPSWADEGSAIFSWQIQGGLIELLDHSYQKKDIKVMVKSMYDSERGSYLRMLLHAPLNYKKKIISLLGVGQLKFLYRFSVNYVSRRLNINVHFKKLKSKRGSIVHSIN